MADIDNKKMWASLIKRCYDSKDSTLKKLANNIRYALLDQNFRYVPKGIVEEIKSDSKEIPTASKEQGLEYNPENNSIEEIKGNDGRISPKFKVGDVIRIKGSGAKGDMITNIYTNEQGFECFEFVKSNDRRICDCDWELVQPETEKSDHKLTEFESAILLAISDYEMNKDDNFTALQSMQKHSYRILREARKQITSEVDVDSIVDEYKDIVKDNPSGILADMTKEGLVRYGCSEVLKAILE